MGVAAQWVHGAKVCVIPHPTNEFRPYALRHRPLAIVSALLISAKIAALGLAGLMPLPAELSTITTSRIVQLTNAERAKAGLSELKVNDALSRAAAAKAQDMLDHDYFAHISPTGVTPWFWMQQENYAYSVAGENLAIDFVEAEDVVAAWMASPSHRENIVRSDYVETGIGVLTGEFEGTNSTVVVHMFGAPQGVAAESEPAAAEPAVLAAEPEPTLAPIGSAPVVVPVPSVAVDASTGTDKLSLLLKGQAGARVSVLVNSQPRAEVTLPASGLIDYTLALADIPDGELVVRAQARQGTVQSDLSAPHVVYKDTEGPRLAEVPYTLIPSPATDQPMALVYPRADDVASLSIVIDTERLYFSSTTPIVIPLSRVAADFVFLDAHGNTTNLTSRELLPAFYAEGDTSYLQGPARFSQFTRRMTAVFLAAIAILLSLAVFIRIRVQHPRMIAHALLVVTLAGTLFVF